MQLLIMTSLCHLLKGNCFNQWQNFAKRLCHPHWYNFILDTLRMVFVQCKFTKCIQPITPGSWQISISRFIDKLIFLCLCIASAWINYRYWTDTCNICSCWKLHFFNYKMDHHVFCLCISNFVLRNPSLFKMSEF